MLTRGASGALARGDLGAAAYRRLSASSSMKDVIEFFSQFAGQWSSNDVIIPVTICFLGFLTFRYLNVRSGNTLSPPQVGHWIPWLGSAITMGKDPDEFMRRTS